MKRFAQWLLDRRPLRIAAVALLFPLPLLTVVSAAVVVLVSMVRGWKVAAEDAVIAVALLLGVTVAAGGSLAAVGIGAGLTWLLAVWLGRICARGSMTLALQAVILLGCAGVLAFTAWSQDPQAYWQQVLADFAARARMAGLSIGATDLMGGAAQIMTGMMAASAVLSALVAMFLGSWLAGTVAASDFGGDFRHLRMGRVLSLLTGVVAAMLVLRLAGVADDLLVVLGSGFVLQGLSIVHWHAVARRWPPGWTLGLYLPLMLFPAVAAVELLGLATLGLVDNVFGLRRGAGKVV